MLTTTVSPCSCATKRTRHWRAFSTVLVRADVKHLVTRPSHALLQILYIHSMLRHAEVHVKVCPWGPVCHITVTGLNSRCPNSFQTVRWCGRLARMRRLSGMPEQHTPCNMLL